MLVRKMYGKSVCERKTVMRFSEIDRCCSSPALAYHGWRRTRYYASLGTRMFAARRKGLGYVGLLNRVY